jgi:DNA polymerase bacteriophage-type
MPWGEKRKVLHFWAVNSLTKQWGAESTYGGRIAENISQAVSRDLMAEAMLNIDERGFDVELSVHDELVSEQDDHFMTVHDYEKLMATTPKWAQGAPIAVEGFKSFRYKK